MVEATPPIVPVVLSGGSGTRLWPASREHRPKQLLPLIGTTTMLQATIDRVAHLPGVEPPIVVTNAEHAIAVERTLAEAGIGDAVVILEPVGRNTAPAIAAAAHVARSDGTDPLLLVLPADHTIADTTAFVEAVSACVDAAASGAVVTFGITPTHPETGYGYIRAGDPVAGALRAVSRFEEKPDLMTAEAYVASGDYSWNSGMFLMRAGTYLSELAAHRSDIASGVEKAMAESAVEGQRVILDADAFEACPSESVDYAVMEHTDHAAVLPIDVGWNDVGSWSSLWDILDHDADGNALRGEVITVDTTNSLVLAGSRVVAVAGLGDVAVIETPDALLVSSLDAAQSVREVAKRLKDAGRPEVESDGTAVATWGTQGVLSIGPGHVVRSIDVDPGASLPIHDDPCTVHLQVLSGTGRLLSDAATSELTAGLSVMVEPKTPWSVENLGQTVLRIIEIRVDTELDVSGSDMGTTRRKP